MSNLEKTRTIVHNTIKSFLLNSIKIHISPTINGGSAKISWCFSNLFMRFYKKDLHKMKLYISVGKEKENRYIVPLLQAQTYIYFREAGQVPVQFMVCDTDEDAEEKFLRKFDNRYHTQGVMTTENDMVECNFSHSLPAFTVDRIFYRENFDSITTIVSEHIKDIEKSRKGDGEEYFRVVRRWMSANYKHIGLNHQVIGGHFIVNVPENTFAWEPPAIVNIINNFFYKTQAWDSCERNDRLIRFPFSLAGWLVSMLVYYSFVSIVVPLLVLGTGFLTGLPRKPKILILNLINPPHKFKDAWNLKWHFTNTFESLEFWSWAEHFYEIISDKIKTSYNIRPIEAWICSYPAIMSFPVLWGIIFFISQFSIGLSIACILIGIYTFLIIILSLIYACEKYQKEIGEFLVKVFGKSIDKWFMPIAGLLAIPTSFIVGGAYWTHEKFMSIVKRIDQWLFAFEELPTDELQCTGEQDLFQPYSGTNISQEPFHTISDQYRRRLPMHTRVVMTFQDVKAKFCKPMRG